MYWSASRQEWLSEKLLFSAFAQLPFRMTRASLDNIRLALGSQILIWSLRSPGLKVAVYTTNGSTLLICTNLEKDTVDNSIRPDWSFDGRPLGNLRIIGNEEEGTTNCHENYMESTEITLGSSLYLYVVTLCSHFVCHIKNCFPLLNQDSFKISNTYNATNTLEVSSDNQLWF